MNTLHKKNHTPATLAQQWQCSERQIRNLVAARTNVRAFRIGVRLLKIPLDAVEEFEKCQAAGSGGFESRFVVNVLDDAGKQLHRYRLNATTAREAEAEAPGVFHELARPRSSTVAELWSAYVVDHPGRAVIATMEHTWKALRNRFGSMHAALITADDCRAHTYARRKAGIKDGTIATELGHLRMMLRWAEKRSLIDRAPYLGATVGPTAKGATPVTREQCRKIIGAATVPHIKLYVVLALATGARNAALLELTWDRCDFERGLVDLRNPDICRPHKGRAIVPMNRAARAALLEAKDGALSDYVIEWAGKCVRERQEGVEGDSKSGRNRYVGVSAPVPSLCGCPQRRGRHRHGYYRPISRARGRRGHPEGLCPILSGLSASSGRRAPIRRYLCSRFNELKEHFALGQAHIE